ncbi:MAG: T9SS type A sorting domain-containing protein [Candidatus Kryptoniota bacterium]
MKRTVCLVVSFLFCFATMAFGQVPASQDTIVIPGGISNVGSIENTVNGDTVTSGARINPNRVYELLANTIYYVQAPILFRNTQDTTATLNLIGQTGGKLPVILSNPQNGGNEFTDVIDGNLTVENVFWDARSIDSSSADLFGIHSRDRRLIMKNVVTEGGGNNLFGFNDPGANMYLYNCYFRDMNWFQNSWNSTIYTNSADTMWVENCTMAYSGLGFFDNNTVRFMYFNHNTIINNTKYAVIHNQYNWAYFVNNVFVNVNWEGECSGTYFTQDFTHVWNGPVDADTVRASLWTPEQGYVPNIDSIVWLESNTIHYTDTCLYAYYRGQFTTGYPSPVSSRNWAPWATDSTNGNIVVQNLPPILFSSVTLGLAKAYKNIYIDWPTIHDSLDPHMKTEANEGWLGDGVRNETALTNLAYWSESNYGVAPSGQSYSPSTFTFGDYNPTHIPGVGTNNGTGITQISDLPENLSYTANITSTIDGEPLGALGWWPNGLSGWDSQAEYQTVVNYYDKLEGIQGVKETNSEIPASYKLAQNYPNPFNPTTSIEYSVPKNGFVTLKVYNVLGQEVSTLFSGVQHAGNYTATFDGSRLASGVYFYRLKAGGVSITKKLVLMK